MRWICNEHPHLNAPPDYTGPKDFSPIKGEEKQTMTTLADKLLIALILTGAAGAITAKIHARSLKAHNTKAVVYLHNEKAGEYPLNKPVTIELTDIKLKIKNDSITVAENTCLKQFCRHGAASKPGDTLICIPKRLYIEIHGNKPEYDSVTM